jgi:hypothetical protein
MIKINKTILIIVLYTLQISVLMAQPGGPGGGPGGGDAPVGGAGIPLDGGALELLLAGVVYLGFTKTKAWFKIKKFFDKDAI